MIEQCSENLKAIGQKQEIKSETTILADSGFHSEANMKYLIEDQIDGYVADNRFRKRDPRFVTAERHKKAIGKRNPKKKYYSPSDFKMDAKLKRPICPNGKTLYIKNRNFVVKGKAGISYIGRQSDCGPCPLRSKCLRKAHTKARQVTFFSGKTAQGKETYTQKMIQKDRHKHRARNLQQKNGSDRTCVCEHPKHHETGSVQLAGQSQSEHPMAAFLYHA